MSWFCCGWVMVLVWVWVNILIWMSHGFDISCGVCSYTYERVLVLILKSHGFNIAESWVWYDWVMVLIWMHHSLDMNESWFWNGCIIVFIWMSHGFDMDAWLWYEYFKSNPSRFRYERIMFAVWISRCFDISDVNMCFLIWMSHGFWHECVTALIRKKSDGFDIHASEHHILDIIEACFWYEHVVVLTSTAISHHTSSDIQQHTSNHMGWLRLLGSLKL